MSRATRRLAVPPAPGGVWPAVLAARPRLLVLDFDGTLASLADHPDGARLNAGTRRVLKRLVAPPGEAVAVLSGRALPDLERKVDMDGLILLGNHGLHSNRRGLGLGGRELGVWKRRAERASRRLGELALAYPGSLLEAKGPDLCLHYRMLAPRLVPELLARVGRIARELPFELRPGKKIVELRPRGLGGKGEAMLRLARSLAPGWDETGVCLFVGDDRSDEDAFAALGGLGPRAVGVKVGPGPTLARFRLAGQAEVETFLRALLRGGMRWNG